MAHRRADLGAGLVRARGRLRPGLAALDRPARRRRAAAGCSTARRPGRSRAAYAHWGFGLFRCDPEAAAAPRADLLPVPARRRRRHRPADRPARRRGRLRRGLLRRRLRARRRRARRTRRRLAGRDEHRRQRARPVAALPRPVLRRRRPAGRSVARDRVRPATSAATASSTPGSAPQAYRLYTWGTVTRLADGGEMGAAGSVNKVFWSELDIALHETALDLLGPEAEVESTLARRLPVLAVRPDLRRHQRDPAQHHRRADPRPAPRAEGGAADEVRAHRRPARLRAVARRRCSPPPTPSRSPAPGPTATTAPGLALWTRLADQGVTDCSPTEATAGRARASRSRRSAGTPCPVRGSSPRPTSPIALGHEVEGVATVAVPPHVPYALDADVADQVVRRRTLSPADGRRRGSTRSTGPGACSRSPATGDDATRTRRSTWPCSRPPPSCSAPASGCSPTRSTYVKQRKQFGREIGSYQAIKHAAGRRPDRARLRPAAGARRRAAARCRGVSAAKVAAGDAAYLASRRRCRCTARSATPRSST